MAMLEIHSELLISDFIEWTEQAMNQIKEDKGLFAEGLYVGLSKAKNKFEEMSGVSDE